MNQLSNFAIFLGDFNTHHNLWTDKQNSNTTGQNLVESLFQYEDLVLLTPFNLPTCYNSISHSYSTLDLIFVTQNLVNMSGIYLGQNMGSDHEPICAKIAFKPEIFKCKKRQKWIYDFGTWS